MIDKNLIIKTIILSILLLSGGAAYGQESKGSNLIVSGHGWYGLDMEKTRPNLASYGYMTYEASVGVQTDPKNGCQFEQAFGYPVLSGGFSLARTSNFKFSDQSKMPDLYSVFGSFERSLVRRSRFSL